MIGDMIAAITHGGIEPSTFSDLESDVRIRSFIPMTAMTAMSRDPGDLPNMKALRSFRIRGPQVVPDL